MKHAEPATGNGPLTGLYRCPQIFPTQEVPEECDLGWEKIDGTWQKGAALLAQEEEAADDTTERQTVKNFIAALKAGTGPTVERLVRTERVCAYLLKHL